MGSRARTFDPGSASRARSTNRQGSLRGRYHQEPSQLYGRDGHLDPQARKQSPSNRSNKESANVRGKREVSAEFRIQEQDQESARDRIRRQNQEHERSRDRSRSRSHRYSPGRGQSKEGHSSKGKERKGRSVERRGCSPDRRSDGLRFEPPGDGPRKSRFDRRSRSSSKDRLGRYSPTDDDVQFVEDSSGIPNKLTPPMGSSRFYEAPFNKEEFDRRSNFNDDMFKEMSEGSLPLNVPLAAAASIGLNNPGFLANQNFVPPQNLLMNLQQPMMGGPQEFPQNSMMNSEFSHNQEFVPQQQSQFVDDSFQGLGGGPDNREEPLIPEFNPETSKLTSREWVRLLDETAKQYHWKTDEKHYIMASRLSGFARQWYLTSGVDYKGWGEFRGAFFKTFTTEMGFEGLLRKMLARIKEDGESMASYLRHKVALLNACDILGRKAVSCILAGLPDIKLRVQAQTHNFEDPDELYLFLRSYDLEPSPQKKPPQKNFQANDSIGENNKNFHCTLCGTLGHQKFQCPQKPKLHKSQSQVEEKESSYYMDNKIMHGSLSQKATYTKYFTDVAINGVCLKGYVDQESECTTIREENARIMKLPIKKQYKVIRGFAGSALSSIGVVYTPLCIDRAIANVSMFVVPDHLQAIPVVVGQSFTEQTHVVVMKDGDKIRFYQRMDNGQTNFDF